MTRDETVLRVVAKVRPGEQWRIARELRRRIRVALDQRDIASDVTADDSPGSAV